MEYFTVENLKKCNLNAVISDRCTQFYWLCYNCIYRKFTMETIKYCLEDAKCDLNFRRDKDSTTPFYWLCKYYDTNGFNLEMMKYCIESGNIDTNTIIRQYSLFNTLCFAIRFSKNDQLPFLKYLLSIGADINMICLGVTSFTWVCNNKRYLKYLGKNKKINQETLNLALNESKFKLSQEHYVKYFKETYNVEESPNIILY